MHTVLSVCHVGATFLLATRRGISANILPTCQGVCVCVFLCLLQGPSYYVGSSCNVCRYSSFGDLALSLSISLLPLMLSSSFLLLLLFFTIFCFRRLIIVIIIIVSIIVIMMFVIYVLIIFIITISVISLLSLLLLLLLLLFHVPLYSLLKI